MWSDPIVEEVRRVRHDIEHKCHDDSETFYQHVVEVQQSFADRLVRRAPKPALVALTRKNRLTNG